MSIVYVCPERDIECGSRPANWCEKCPQRRASPAAVPEGALPPLPEQPEELRARWKCEDCAGHGHTGETIPGSHFQPPEPELCGTCQGAGWVETAALLPEQATTPEQSDTTKGQV